MTEDFEGGQSYRFCAGKSINEMMAPTHPRHVLLTHRPWMEAYCSLDEGELQHRSAAVLAHGDGFALWMGVLSLYHAAFTHPYTFDTKPRETYASALFRLDLLGLAGGNIKLAMDAALAGYYSACMGLERHMLETWRRVAYARLHPKDVWCWVPRSVWPTDVQPASDSLSAKQGGMPTSIPKADQIADTITTLGDDVDRMFLAKVRAGFDSLSDHSHPSFAGATQTWQPSDLQRRNFGPTYQESLALRCLDWGLVASAMLLTEVGRLAPQGASWDAQLDQLKVDSARWGLAIRDQHNGTSKEDDIETRE